MATGAFFVIYRNQLHAPISLEHGHIHDGAASCPANGRDASGADIRSLMTGRRGSSPNPVFAQGSSLWIWAQDTAR